MFRPDAEGEASHRYFKRDEAVRKYRNLKQSDAHWLKVRQDGGQHNVHVDFVASSTTGKVKRTNTTMVKISLENGLQRSDDDQDTVMRSKHRRASTSRRHSSAEGDEDIAKAEAIRAASATTAKKKCRVRMRACALCEQEFAEDAMGSEQIRSSILQLRRIFIEVQSRESVHNSVNPFAGKTSALSPAKRAKESLASLISSSLAASGRMSEPPCASDRDEDDVARTAEKSISTMTEKYRYSRMYDKVRVCLFCSQFFPYENFRKASSRHRRGAKVKTEPRNDHGLATGDDLQETMLGSVSPLPSEAKLGVQAHAPTFRLKRQSAVSAWRMQKLRAKVSKEREAQMATIQELHGVLDVLARDLDGGQRLSRRKVQAKISAFVNNAPSESPWRPGGASPVKRGPTRPSSSSMPCTTPGERPATARASPRPKSRKVVARRPRSSQKTDGGLGPRSAKNCGEATRRKKSPKTKAARADHGGLEARCGIPSEKTKGENVDMEEDEEEERARLAREAHAASFEKVKRAIHAIWLAKSRERENKNSTFRPSSLSSFETCLADELKQEMRRLEAQHQGSLGCVHCPETSSPPC